MVKGWNKIKLKEKALICWLSKSNVTQLNKGIGIIGYSHGTGALTPSAKFFTLHILMVVRPYPPSFYGKSNDTEKLITDSLVW